MFSSLRTSALRTFFIIWFGQFVSIVGSGLTSFALGVYVFQQTGQTTDFALISAFITLPGIILAPFAGTVVDRYNRRTVMILSDTAAALTTGLVAILLLTDRLNIWHIYLVTALGSSANIFHFPAYAAVTAQLAPKRYLARANGLVQLAASLSGIAAPVLAGFMIAVSGLVSVIILDIVTFFFGVITLLLVRVPSISQDQSDGFQSHSIRQDVAASWRYIRLRPGLLALLIFNAAINIIAVSEMLVTPLVLSFSTEESLGIVLGMGGLGFLIGSLFMSVFGGPRRLVIGVIFFEMITGTTTFLMGLRASVIWIAGVIFIMHFTYPVALASSMTLWQRKVPKAMHGRVMALRRMLIWLMLPLTFLLAGPLVDQLLQPAMLADGALAGSAGRIIGIGEGRGIGLMMVITGIINIIAAIIALSYRPLRQIETDLPDADDGV